MRAPYLKSGSAAIAAVRERCRSGPFFGSVQRAGPVIVYATMPNAPSPLPEAHPAVQPVPNGMDRFAITLSGLCLLHCLLIPVVLAMAPAFSSLVLGTETTVHWVFLGMAVPTSVWALWRGYGRCQHLRALVLGIAGLLVMFLGVSHLFDPRLEVPLTLVGVTMVVVAHVLNLRIPEPAPRG